MAQIHIGDILGVLEGLDIVSGRNDVTRWSGWITGDGKQRPVEVTRVSFEETALELDVTDGAVVHTLLAAPNLNNIEKTTVWFDGQEMPNAGLVFAWKGGISHPLRFAFDWRPIPLNGGQARFNMRYTV